MPSITMNSMITGTIAELGLKGKMLEGRSNLTPNCDIMLTNDFFSMF